MRLKGRVALVTGGAQGIGAACVRLLAKEGAKVVINYHSSKESAETLVMEIQSEGGDVKAIHCDLTKHDQVQAMFQEVIEVYDSLDILVNNAGVIHPKPADEVTDEIFNSTLDANLKGVFYCMQEAARYMKSKGGGKIVSISSISGIVGSQSSAPYAASKAGVDALTKTLATELGPFNINVNAVAPGPVRTSLLTDNYSQEKIELMAEATPLKRIAEPEDIARAVLFFASKDSEFVNGQTLIVDGGRILR